MFMNKYEREHTTHNTHSNIVYSLHASSFRLSLNLLASTNCWLSFSVSILSPSLGCVILVCPFASTHIRSFSECPEKCFTAYKQNSGLISSSSTLLSRIFVDSFSISLIFPLFLTRYLSSFLLYILDFRIVLAQQWVWTSFLFIHLSLLLLLVLLSFSHLCLLLLFQHSLLACWFLVPDCSLAQVKRYRL